MSLHQETASCSCAGSVLASLSARAVPLTFFSHLSLSSGGASRRKPRRDGHLDGTFLTVSSFLSQLFHLKLLQNIRKAEQQQNQVKTHSADPDWLYCSAGGVDRRTTDEMLRRCDGLTDVLLLSPPDAAAAAADRAPGLRQGLNLLQQKHTRRHEWHTV